MRAHRESLLGAMQAILLITVVSLFGVTFVAQPFRIPSESMEPTLAVGDFLMVDKQAYSPQGFGDGLLPPSGVRRGDVAVFHFPVDASMHLVKRVVALPGDHLHLHNGRLSLNGRDIAEPYAVFSTVAPDTYRDEFPALHSLNTSVNPQWFEALRAQVRDGDLWVPQGKYFVMGDNRNDSEDSRYWGFVPQADLVGRPIAVYFSLPPGEGTMGWAAKWHRVKSSLRLVR